MKQIVVVILIGILHDYICMYVCVCLRYMYWTDWGSFPRIERAFMNGEERMDLVNHTLHWPNGLTIDHVYNKLYWADAGEDNIEVMDLETLERKVVLNQKFLFCK